MELLDLGILGIGAGLGFAAIVEDDMAVLEEFFLPAVKEDGSDAELFAELRDGNGFEEMPLD